MSVKTWLLDITKRLIKFDKKLGIINNGIDNAYSERMERFINNSVTAKTSSNIMAAYLAGKGFGEDNDKIIVNTGTTLQKFGFKTSKSLSKQRGVWIHINYNMNFKFDNFDTLPYTHCRLGKKDSNKYNGKVIVYDNFTGENGKIDKTKFQVVDVFNPDPVVIQSQVDKVKGWDNYKGQIWYVNLDEEYDYALSTIDAVSKDCDSEAQASEFKNNSLRKGFFGKTLVVTKPLAYNLEYYGTGEEGALKYQTALSERDDFKKVIDDFLGAQNVGGVMHVEMEHDGESFDNAIKIETIKSNIDDKIFRFTEESVFKNILMAFNNLPGGLVRSDSTLFANSGESLQVMKETYQENTTQERDEMEQVVQVLMSNFKNPVEGIKIIPLIETEETEIARTDGVEPGTTKDEDSERKKAQATLKGSVGGVTALLEIQKSVSSGETDRDSALTIIEEIFGINRDLAGKMLGEVKEEENGTTD